jgi:hypothetical protein
MTTRRLPLLRWIVYWNRILTKSTILHRATAALLLAGLLFEKWAIPLMAKTVAKWLLDTAREPQLIFR